jgi:hypothetical protein
MNWSHSRNRRHTEACRCRFQIAAQLLFNQKLFYGQKCTQEAHRPLQFQDVFDVTGRYANRGAQTFLVARPVFDSTGRNVHRRAQTVPDARCIGLLLQMYNEDKLREQKEMLTAEFEKQKTDMQKNFERMAVRTPTDLISCYCCMIRCYETNVAL